MALLRLPILVSSAIALASHASSFTLNTCNNKLATGRSSSTKLFQLIQGDAADDTEELDENAGGVGLANRSAIKITGVSGTAQELVRYEKITEVDVSVAKSIMESADCQLVCSGSGQELYMDPGSSNKYDDKVVRLAPHEAAQKALTSMASAVTIGEGTKSVVMNFLGGDDLIVGEVLQACDMLVDGFDFPAKTKFTFNSVSFTDVPTDVCTVTVVASAGKAGGLEGVDQSVARGELYNLDGKWYTVSEDDITTATK